MARKIVIALLVLALFSVAGCEELSGLTQDIPQSSSADLKIEKAVELGSAWKMKQMRFRVAAGDETAILMKLSPGEEVDGYFYLEKGEDIRLSITGKQTVYRSPLPAGGDADNPASDRFSFIATEAEGDTYTLTFRNPAEEGDGPAGATVYLEVIYPVSASLYVPVEPE